ncbi:MAG TPA: M48 family metalloprotease [Candidatus Sulfotelmatobacter sp.]|nr:M48 family metalloprotease [Candidatus Sulfotelmatobacter sp.]
MRFPVVPSALVRRACAPFLLGILIALLAAPLSAKRKDVPRIVPPAESPAQDKDKEIVSEKNAEKYDIEHIGSRGIGHGFNLYSLKREHSLGQSMAVAFDRTTRPVTDPIVNDYVNRLAQRIVRNSDAVVPFIVKVIDSGEMPRAYGLPGGFLYVDSALILASDGEAELATVMAHEIAHVAARHATRALTRRDMSNILGSMAMIAGPAGIAMQDAGGIAGPLSVKKFYRDAEYEADLLAIEYSYAAGYDPQSYLGALEKLHAFELQRNQNLAKIPGYHFASKIPFHSKIARGFSSYPLTEERIGRLQSEISAYLPTRKDYILDTDEFQDVKAHLLAAQTPVLHHHSGDDDNKVPVLRRTADSDSDIPNGPAPNDHFRGTEAGAFVAAHP